MLLSRTRTGIQNGHEELCTSGVPNVLGLAPMLDNELIGTETRELLKGMSTRFVSILEQLMPRATTSSYLPRLFQIFRSLETKLWRKTEMFVESSDSAMSSVRDAQVGKFYRE